MFSLSKVKVRLNFACTVFVKVEISDFSLAFVYQNLYPYPVECD